MDRKNRKNPLLLVLAVLALASALVTIVQFFISRNFLEFWSFPGIVSIVFVIGFLWAMLGLIRFYSDEWADRVISILRNGCLIAGPIIFFLFCRNQTLSKLSLAGYIGFAVLFGAAVFFGNFTASGISKRLLEYISYIYALLSLWFGWVLMNKYVFHVDKLTQGKFPTAILMGEIILLIVGIITFTTMYTSSNE